MGYFGHHLFLRLFLKRARPVLDESPSSLRNLSDPRDSKEPRRPVQMNQLRTHRPPSTRPLPERATVTCLEGGGRRFHRLGHPRARGRARPRTNCPTVPAVAPYQLPHGNDLACNSESSPRTRTSSTGRDGYRRWMYRPLKQWRETLLFMCILFR